MFEIFGKNPSGKRLEKIKKSPNYKNGQFQNIIPTEVLLKSASVIKVFKDFLNKPDAVTPKHKLPTVKTDLKNLSAEKPVVIWLGHSSYLIKVNQKIILVDPVLSGRASPVSFIGNSFPGTDIYAYDDFPEIDLLIITHDHYDHLDYKTINALNKKIKHFYMPLGVGSHFEHWGISSDKITEFDWWDTKSIEKDIELIATPSRHFSGRRIKRNKTLWTSFVLNIFEYRFYIGGDSGYSYLFKQLGEKYGPFDIAMVEMGQYNESWPHIHMMPEETIKAAKDLKAKVLLPVHWGKFALAYHEWNEPIKRLLNCENDQVKITTPMIGEPVILGGNYPTKSWWI